MAVLLRSRHSLGLQTTVADYRPHVTPHTHSITSSPQLQMVKGLCSFGAGTALDYIRHKLRRRTAKS